MSIWKDRLELIRERHRKLILAPRERLQMEAFDEDWEQTFEALDDETVARKFDSKDEDEEA